eukprot:TRINITY_DN24390_c0_g1_i1.p1 TRINITY_DN24390_c0_g1~~TRINITY_DN24390_c0_g1_i1.p1  ORF type:complete len:649 (+),score=102.74 TRINITY_DN24390_c0_g1_i1:124-2070(+)
MSQSDPLTDEVKKALRSLLETATALTNCELGSDKLVSNETNVYYVAAKSKAVREVIVELGERLEQYLQRLKDTIIDQMLNVFEHLPRRSPTILLDKAVKSEPENFFFSERQQSTTVSDSTQKVQQQEHSKPSCPAKPAQKSPSLSTILSSYSYLQMKALTIRISAQRTSLWLLTDIYENGKAKNSLKCSAMYPQSSSYSLELSPSQGICGPVMQTGVALNFRCAKQSTLFTPETCRALGVDTNALLCFPILRGINRVCVGVLFASNKSHSQSERFTELDEISCCETVELISRVLGGYGNPSGVSPDRVPQKILHGDGNGREFDSDLNQTATTVLTSSISDYHQALPNVPPQLVTDVHGARQLQHIYRTGAKPSHISGKETITAKAVIMDGSNLTDLSQQLSWMEQMWRGSLDENTILHSECRWWQGRTAESQAKLRWLQRQIDRAQRVDEFSQAKMLLSQLPPETDNEHELPSKPDTARVRDYTNESITDVGAMKQKWIACLGIPNDDKCTQTDAPDPKQSPYKGRTMQSFASRASRFNTLLPSAPSFRKTSRVAMRVPAILGLRKRLESDQSNPSEFVSIGTVSSPLVNSFRPSRVGDDKGPPMNLSALQSPFESTVESILPSGVCHDFPPNTAKDDFCGILTAVAK